MCIILDEKQDLQRANVQLVTFFGWNKDVHFAFCRHVFFMITVFREATFIWQIYSK